MDLRFSLVFYFLLGLLCVWSPALKRVSNSSKLGKEAATISPDCIVKHNILLPTCARRNATLAHQCDVLVNRCMWCVLCRAPAITGFQMNFLQARANQMDLVGMASIYNLVANRGDPVPQVVQARKINT